jgi:hypothetical protein
VVGDAVFETTSRSACATDDTTVTPAQLFPGVPSDGPLPESATQALLSADPAAVSRAGTVTDALALAASGPPRVQVIVTGPAIG